MVDAFDEEIATLAIEEAGLEPEKLLLVDLWVRDIGPGALSGAGVVIINPPYGLREHLDAAIPWLCNLLDQAPDGEMGAAWRVTGPAEVQGEEDDYGYDTE